MRGDRIENCKKSLKFDPVGRTYKPSKIGQVQSIVTESLKNTIKRKDRNGVVIQNYIKFLCDVFIDNVGTILKLFCQYKFQTLPTSNVKLQFN